jgi:DNA-directed RNA polymerase subunit RPC12/RpoP
MIATTQEGRCPVCRAKVVARGEEEVIIRNAILRAEPSTGRVAAKCARCKSWVEVPLRYVAE